jgi:hypothetical protein
LESVNRYSILWQHPWSSLRRKTEENVLEPGRIEDKIREGKGKDRLDMRSWIGYKGNCWR